MNPFSIYSAKPVFSNVVIALCISTLPLRERMAYAYHKGFQVVSLEHVPVELQPEFSKLTALLQSEGTIEETLDNMTDTQVEECIQKCVYFYEKLIRSEKSK